MRPDRARACQSSRGSGGLPAGARARRQFRRRGRPGVGRGEPGHRRGQRQVAGRHLRGAARTATAPAAAARPGPGRRGPASRQPAQPVLAGQDAAGRPRPCPPPPRRRDVVCPRRSSGSAAAGSGACSREAVPRGEDHQREAGRPLRPRWSCAAALVSRGAAPAPAPAHGPPGRLVPALADRLGGQPARRHVPGSTRPASSTSTSPTPAPASSAASAAPTRPAPLTCTRSARRAASRRSPAARLAGGPGTATPDRGAAGPGPSALSAQGVGRAGRRPSRRPAAPPPPAAPPARRHGRPAAPCAAALLAQQRQPARAVEQVQETARRRVHRAQHHGVRGCHPELHGVAVPPAAPQRGLHHRMHDRPPSPVERPRVSVRCSCRCSADECQHARAARGGPKVVHRRWYSSYKSMRAVVWIAARTVPEAGLPPLRSG